MCIHIHTWTHTHTQTSCRPASNYSRHILVMKHPPFFTMYMFILGVCIHTHIHNTYIDAHAHIYGLQACFDTFLSWSTHPFLQCVCSYWECAYIHTYIHTYIHRHTHTYTARRSASNYSRHILIMKRPPPPWSRSDTFPYWRFQNDWGLGNGFQRFLVSVSVYY